MRMVVLVVAGLLLLLLVLQLLPGQRQKAKARTTEGWVVVAVSEQSPWCYWPTWASQTGPQPSCWAWANSPKRADRPHHVSWEANRGERTEASEQRRANRERRQRKRRRKEKGFPK
jgi:hypothetical protein